MFESSAPPQTTRLISGNPLSRWIGKRRVDFLEVVGAKRGPAPRRRWIQRNEQRAEAEVVPLRKWERISDRSYATYTAGANVVRLRRLLELVPDGARILDVGIGFGYVSGILVRDRCPSHYCGVDLKQSYLDATTSMLEENDLPDERINLDVLDVYELSPEFIGEHRPDLILLLEVLEHVPDPALALRKISAACPRGTQVLFTVPLHGRLEAVWGHLSLFERSRLERLCSQAGMKIERLEPVASTWALVVATTDGDAAGQDDPGAESAYSFTSLSTRLAAGEYRRPDENAVVEIRPGRAYLSCAVSAPEGARTPITGGFRFEAEDPGLLRIELEVEPPDEGCRLAVRGLDADGVERLSWTADVERDQPSAARTTYLLKPGRRSKSLGPLATDPQGVRWIEIVTELEPGCSASMKLYRAAWVTRGGDGRRLKHALRARLAAD